MIGLVSIRPLIRLAVVYMAWCVAHVAHAQQDPLMQRIQDLDSKLIELSSQIHLTAGLSPRHRDMPNLVKEFVSLVKRDAQQKAVSLLYSHSQLLQNKFDHPGIFELSDFLLRHNEKALADKIRQEIVADNDLSLVASISLVFARYHANRQEWSDCLHLLPAQTASELSGKAADEAYLLRGSALQQHKKHREAIDAYDRIPVASPHYLHARLNTAIASIRQGWMAEASAMIKQIIPLATRDHNRALTDRLYLILGYAFLQKEYYRDARDAFRQIDKNSRYVSRALLGIGLTASSQADYVGGLNALSLLRNRAQEDLPVAESYLVTPYLYEKLQDEKIISASYSEAIEHYQSQLLEIDLLINTNTSLEDIKLDDDAGNLHIDQLQLHYRPAYPDYFFTNYRKLLSLNKNPGHPSLQDRIRSLSSRYRQTFDDIIDQLLDQRKQHLRSYLNQSRYGLARLYDQPAETGN